MKFRIAQEDLAKALLVVNKSILPRPNLPVLANVLMSVNKNRLEVLATNLETATRVAVECKGEIDGKVCLPGKLFWEFVSQLPPEDVLFEKLGEEAVVATSKHSARFATMATEDFPAIPKIEKGQTVGLVAQDLLKAVTRVAFSAASDEGRPVLTGVLCEFAKDSVSMVATDGYRLSFQKIAVSGKMASPLKMVIPAQCLMEVAKIISEFGEGILDKSLQLVIADSLNQVNFKIDGPPDGEASVEFTSRLIEGEFPNWQKIIPTAFSSKARVAREELIKIIRLTSIFARDAGNIVRLKLEANGAGGARIIGFAQNNQIGSNEAQCQIELEGTGGEIAFNFRYLLEMLASVEGEEIVFEMIESLNPGRLTLTNEPDFFHIVMPVRLQA